jgi:hypothetical protein
MKGFPSVFRPFNSSQSMGAVPHMRKKAASRDATSQKALAQIIIDKIKVNVLYTCGMQTQV